MILQAIACDYQIHVTGADSNLIYCQSLEMASMGVSNLTLD